MRANERVLVQEDVEQIKDNTSDCKWDRHG
jgi:hypothetical protein